MGRTRGEGDKKRRIKNRVKGIGGKGKEKRWKMRGCGFWRGWV